MSYEELVKEHGYCEGLVGTNENGEYVMVSIDNRVASVRTLQSNGWQRINNYYYNGTEEEYYEK